MLNWPQCSGSALIEAVGGSLRVTAGTANVRSLLNVEGKRLGRLSPEQISNI